MMRAVTLTTVLLLLSFPTAASALSAWRPGSVDYTVAATWHAPSGKKRILSGTVLPTATVAQSAYASAVPFADLDISVVAMEKHVDKLFEYVRGNRELDDPTEPSFLRRIPWLYPQDGCWIRASLAGQWAEREKYSSPHKLFIFGNLNVVTANSVAGKVTWWFHVVAAIRDSAGDLFVLDPAIHAAGPMKLKDWVLTMVADVKDAKLSLCSAHTYEPYDDCEATTAGAGLNAKSDITYYLTMERSELNELGRNVDDELGDLPPWKSASTHGLPSIASTKRGVMQPR